MRRLLPLLLAAVFLNDAAAARQPSPAIASLRVLFIGNSLTAANDLPGLVSSLSRAAGHPIEGVSVTFGNHSLQDHWKRGDARKAIAQGGWAYVVLQQGPSALPDSRVSLRQYVRRFDVEIKRAGARTALYMVWPSAMRSADFDGVVTSYTTAARDVGGLLLPVGEAWRSAWRRDRGLRLYADDGFHPTTLGSYLAALVIYERLAGRSAVAVPPIVPIVPATLQVLRDSAADVNKR
jgi:hypothetical protein